MFVFSVGYCQFQLLGAIYVCEISLASIPLSAKLFEDVGLSLVRFHVGCQQNSIRKEVEFFFFFNSLFKILIISFNFYSFCLFI